MGQKPGGSVRLEIEGEVRELEVLGIENAMSASETSQEASSGA